MTDESADEFRQGERRKLRDGQNRRLGRLLVDQHNMVARRQLTELGIVWDAVEANVAARRWVVRSPRVISATTGELTVEQRRWLGVLHAGPRSMLGGMSAAARHGLVGWERDDVTVLVDDELSFGKVDGIRFFRSRRPFQLMLSPRPGIPSAQLEPALLLWAGYEGSLRAGVGALAASVQQRLTTPGKHLKWLDLLKPLRRSQAFRSALIEIDGGAHSTAELDIARMCRDFEIPLPHRQTPRSDRGGKRRWTDCEWDLPDGSVLVLEVDGGLHIEVRQWGDDLKRGRRITSLRRIVIRCTAYELRHEPGEVAVDLIALGLSGRMPDSAA